VIDYRATRWHRDALGRVWHRGAISMAYAAPRVSIKRHRRYRRAFAFSRQQTLSAAHARHQA